MNVKKFLISFAIFISIGLVLHFIYNYFQSFSNNDVSVDYLYKINRDFSNKEKFTKLLNAFNVSCDINITVVVLVLCRVRDNIVRNTIRHTWGQWTTSRYSNHTQPNISNIQYHSSAIQLYFVLGSETTNRNDISKELKLLHNESHYNDIMFFPGLKDSYMNLTLKTLTSLNEGLRSCPRVTYFLKVDTDVFLNVPMLIDFCNNNFEKARRQPMIFGNKQIGAPVIRDKGSKWYVPNDKFPNEYFPPYVTGCGYILSRFAVEKVIATALTVTELFAWEDVAVTGLYSKDTTIIDTKLFRYENFENSADICFMKSIILTHRISTKKMAAIWNDIVSNKTLCSRESLGFFNRLIGSLTSG